MGKQEVKLSLLPNYKILYIENPKTTHTHTHTHTHTNPVRTNTLIQSSF